MKVFDRISQLRDELDRARQAGRSIEFVPTMGAFHKGHLELIRTAGRRSGVQVVSIFVNPLQFGPQEDFETYPRDLQSDLAAAETEGVDVVFVPPVEQMFPDEGGSISIDVGRLGDVFEGSHRPGHFSGVALVCTKLFNIVGPDRVYLGAKDAQQVAVLQQLVHDLNLPVELVVCPTVREDDGLAMSSRNRMLDSGARTAASSIYAGLSEAKRLAERGETSAPRVVAAARRVLDEQPAVSLQYLEVVHPQTFESVVEVSPGTLIVAAALVGSVRLIDNCIVGTAQRPEREEDQ